ncbi:MerC domain-containing protein [Saccharicrinis fermentans]
MASSTLCLVHCILTPFIFIAQACAASCCAEAPAWWRAIDLIFLIISFTAVYFSAKSSSKAWIKVSLYITFIVFFILMANEHTHTLPITRYPMYIAAGILAGLHFYNRRFSACPNNCCPN